MPALAAALVLTTIFTGSITGLHADEAWVMLRAADITNGVLPLSGMNFYTGPLNQYLVWPFLAATGYQVWALRLASALLNVLAVFFALDTVRILHPRDPQLWRWTAALWVTSVPFVLFSRFAVETTMLSPVLVFGAVWLVAVAVHARSPISFWVAGIGGGFLLGMAVYNHLIVTAIAAALGLGALLGFGLRLLRQKILWATCAGFILGLVPRLIGIINEFASRSDGMLIAPMKAIARMLSISYRMLSWDTLQDCLYLPIILAGIVDGDLMFRRFVGENLIPVIPYFSSTLLMLGCACLWGARRKPIETVDRALLGAWLSMPLAIFLITPFMALRYFELPMLVAPYALVRFVLAISRAQDASGRRQKIGQVLLGAVLALQISYITIDYFWAFAGSGGQLASFQLGLRLTETSNHFVRTDRLYRQLIKADVRVVTASEFISWNLAAYDITAHRLSLTPFDPRDPNPIDPDGRVAMVFYNTKPVRGGVYDPDMRDVHELKFGGARYQRESDFDKHFIVFIGREQ